MAALGLLAGCGRIGFDPLGDLAPGSWWDPRWSRRIPIAVNPSLSSEDLYDFPLLVRVDNDSLVARSVEEFQFTDADGTVLAHEVEQFSATDGSLLAWVSVPLIEPGSGADLFLYFDGPPGASASTDVWRDYELVVHGILSEGLVVNSTGKTPNGLLDGTATQGEGVIAGAVRFVDEAGHVDFDQAEWLLDGWETFQVSFWFRSDAASWGPDSGEQKVFRKDGSMANARFYPTGSVPVEGGRFQVDTEFALKGRTFCNMPVVFDEITYLAVSFDGETYQGHDQGVQQFTDAQPGDSLIASSAPFALGGGGEKSFTGFLDEFRISRVARSSGWIAAEYANQLSPVDTLEIGTTESR